MQALLHLDEKVFSWLNHFAGQSVFWDGFWYFMAEYTIFLVALGTILFIIKKTKEEEMMTMTAFLGVLIGRFILVPFIRLFLFRPRPFLEGGVIQLIPKDPGEASFPSGHTVIMFALAFAVFKRHKGWGSLMFAFALLSGVARVVSGVHYPGDILAGIIIGFLAFLIAEEVVRLGQRYFKKM